MLSQKIKALRTEKGLSQQAFALRLNVVRQTVSKWEQGLSQPDADMLTRIADELDTTVAALLGEKTEAPAMPKKAAKNTRTSVLLIAGSPVWVALLIAALAVGFSLFVSLWAVIVSVWVAFGSVCLAAPLSFGNAIACLVVGAVPSAFAFVGGAVFSAGLAIFLFFGCKAATKGSAWLTKVTVDAIRRRLPRKEGAV